MIKDEGELARIERAADIADVALAQVKEMLRESPTEHDFAIALDFEMHPGAAQRRSRSTPSSAAARTQRSPPRAALRTAHRPGELVVIDFGAVVDGYRSDMTRTLCVGEVRSNELRNLLEAVLHPAGSTTGLRPLAV